LKYLLSVRDSFAAAHRLVGSGGKCENLHGHNFKVELTVGGDDLDDSGMLMDFTDLKKILKSILSDLDHRDLNTVHPFSQSSPSSERIAEYIYQRASQELDGGSADVVSVTVSESDTASATYRPRLD
jgi:6-pyruvoyltetrahydropterin/6-carboxytetrahydropterin synthase